MLRAASVVAGTCSWLVGVVQNYAPWDGAKLKMVRENELSKPIRALDTYHGRLHLQFSFVSFKLLGQKAKEQAEVQEWMDTTIAGPSNLSTSQPVGGDGTVSAVDSPSSIGTAHTITHLLESQMVDLLRTPPSEANDSIEQEC
ncbi:hypothetical protein Trydic_g22711 [Trypoxylus dichotomus]